MRIEHYLGYALGIHLNLGRRFARIGKFLTPRFLATDSSKAVMWVYVLLNANWSGFFMSYFVFYCFLPLCKIQRSNTSAEDERAD